MINKRNYWAGHFSQQAVKYPKDDAKALDFSNDKLMSQVHDTILEGIDLESVTSILDAGSGLGKLMEGFGSKLKGLNKKTQVYGIDVSFEMIKKSKIKIYRLYKKPAFLLMDFVNLGFKDSSMDCTICSESLQYSDPYLVLEELIRVTRHQNIISVPNVYNSIIQKAIKKNMGRYSGVKIDRLIPFVENIGKCTGVQIYPLIFSENQRLYIYEKMMFFDHPDLSPVHVHSANRFVIKINLDLKRAKEKKQGLSRDNRSQ